MLQRAARHWNSDSPDDWILNVADRRSAGKQHLEWLNDFIVDTLYEHLWFSKSLLIFSSLSDFVVVNTTSNCVMYRNLYN